MKPNYRIMIVTYLELIEAAGVKIEGWKDANGYHYWMKNGKWSIDGNSKETYYALRAFWHGLRIGKGDK